MIQLCIEASYIPLPCFSDSGMCVYNSNKLSVKYRQIVDDDDDCCTDLNSVWTTLMEVESVSL